jgi:hypothetical protein
MLVAGQHSAAVETVRHLTFEGLGPLPNNESVLTVMSLVCQYVQMTRLPVEA